MTVGEDCDWAEGGMLTSTVYGLSSQRVAAEGVAQSGQQLFYEWFFLSRAELNKLNREIVIAIRHEFKAFRTPLHHTIFNPVMDHFP